MGCFSGLSGLGLCEEDSSVLGFDTEKLHSPSFIGNTGVGTTNAIFEKIMETVNTRFNDAMKEIHTKYGERRRRRIATHNAKITGQINYWDNVSKIGSRIGTRILPGVGVIYDPISGINKNIKDGNVPTDRIVTDAVTDLAVSGGAVWLGLAFGGPAVLIGGGAYILSDVITIKGKSLRDYAKDGVNKAYHVTADFVLESGQKKADALMEEHARHPFN